MRRDSIRIRVVKSLLVLLAAFAPVHAQVTFEVASIKPSAIQPNGRYGNYRMAGGPGTNDPGRMVLENFDIRSLILKAYDLPMYRLIVPDWTFDVRFDVNANIPAGTTKEQFLAMQQNLLATRLGLVVHREKKEMPVYELVVAKGGSKLKEAAPPGEEADISASFVNGMKRDDEGFPILPPGHTMYAIAMDHARPAGLGRNHGTLRVHAFESAQRACDRCHRPDGQV